MQNRDLERAINLLHGRLNTIEMVVLRTLRETAAMQPDAECWLSDQVTAMQLALAHITEGTTRGGTQALAVLEETRRSAELFAGHLLAKPVADCSG